ncbi:MAG: ATP-binding protein [Alphaproteobacteria bacterium]
MMHRLERFRDRDETEHEQILVRIAISLVIAVILVGVAMFGSSSAALTPCLWLVAFLLLAAFAFLAHYLWKPGANPARRCAAMVLDIGCLSAGMILGEALMAPLYPLFLWVILGMGFRYGRGYLLIAALMGVAGFGTVVLIGDDWKAQPLLAGSLLLALVVIPAYASTLLARLTDALKQAEESNRTKNRFLGTMSHELRTPLNAIFGMSDLLASSRLSAGQQDMVATVRSAGHTLLELIDDLLDIARIESGRLEARKDRFDLHLTLAIVLRLLRHQASKKGLELRASYDPRLPPIVIGSERWLKQILLNLIGNAIKFTDEGEVVLAVRVREVTEDSLRILFEITDTGIGIAEDAQERIFERFAQADDSTSRSYGGSGLGLSIARQLAAMMGGSLTVESTLGEGSCFRLDIRVDRANSGPHRLSGRIAVVGEPERAGASAARLRAWGAETSLARHPSDVFGYLETCGERRAVLILDDGQPPLAADFSGKLRSWFQEDKVNQVLLAADGSEPHDPSPYVSVLPPDPSDELLYNALHAALAVPGSAERESQARPAASGQKILVAEDNPINQKVIRKMLASAGHSVVLADSGEALLDRLDDGDFDLVFVDLNMPKMSGMDAVKLHRMGVGTDHPPFVALTADATEETRQACSEVGFAAYITKPFEMHDVLDAVERLSRTHRQAPAHANMSKVIRHPRFADHHVTLDMNYLRKLRTLDPDPAFFVEIVNDFIDDARGLIDELEEAADAADDIACRDRSHALQSSAAYIGAVGLSSLCQEWRDVGPDQLRKDGADRVAKIRAEFRRLCTELRSLLDDDGVGGLGRSQ